MVHLSTQKGESSGEETTFYHHLVVCYHVWSHFLLIIILWWWVNDLDIALLELDRWNQFDLIEHGMGDAGFCGTPQPPHWIFNQHLLTDDHTLGLADYGVQIDTPPGEPGTTVYHAFASHCIIVENVITTLHFLALFGKLPAVSLQGRGVCSVKHSTVNQSN